MTVRIEKPAFNVREKLSELDIPVGTHGTQLMKSADAAESFDLVQAGRKNLIINGGFDIWQRATDSGSNTTDGYLSADRWKHASSGATKQVTRQTFTLGQTEVPGNPKYFLRYAVTTSNNNVAIRQCIEDVTRTAGRKLTLSFWVKGSNCGGGEFDLMFRQDFGTGGSVSSVVDTNHFSYSVNDTWTRKTFTFTPPSIVGKTLGTDANSSFYKIELFRQPDGDNSTGAFTLDFANVQLEYGSQATEFEQRSLGEELALCQRYYEVLYMSSGTACCYSTGDSTIKYAHTWYFKQEKRAQASVALLDDAAFSVSGGSTITLTGIFTSKDHVMFYYNGGMFRLGDNDQHASVKAESEL